MLTHNVTQWYTTKFIKILLLQVISLAVYSGAIYFCEDISNVVHEYTSTLSWRQMVSDLYFIFNFLLKCWFHPINLLSYKSKLALHSLTILPTLLTTNHQQGDIDSSANADINTTKAFIFSISVQCNTPTIDEDWWDLLICDIVFHCSSWHATDC